MSELAGFEHSCYARIRGVQRLEQAVPTIAVVADRIPGTRLSEILAVAEQQLLPLQSTGALCLIRQLVTAIAMLHDRMGPVAMQAIGEQPHHVDWVLPMGILASVFALCMLPFLLGIERTTAVAFALAGAVYVGGAVGAEMIGKLASDAYGYESYPYVLAVTLEEGMEMLGVALFLRAILRHIARAGWTTLVSVR